VWLATIAYNCLFLIHKQSHFNQFGNLLLTTEALMFTLPTAAIFAGFFELMMRERAGFPRPTWSRTKQPEHSSFPKGMDRL
jgi:hypothetical protein